MKLAVLVTAVSIGLFSLPAIAAKKCEELKTEIVAKLDTKGVKGYALEIVAADQVGDKTVVGSCEGGKKKISYSRKK